MKLISILMMVLLGSVVQAKPDVLLQSTTSWDGGAIEYPQGQAEITTVKLRFEANDEVPFHCHPVPTFGYVVEGTLKVETKEGKTTILKKGDPAVEVMRTVHKGTPIDGPVEIIVFYAGAEGVPNTVFPDKDPEHQHCNP
ncbi:hypothetical protein NBRC116188_08190 [Oceaniserpentilla sp. 4NH20-0058]|uniref:cupin domain-containing protein n=1 Tax=Oceaniserpentilla sp. 4NH20-0058 TaxID=3127660 RepID=UPI00310A412B